jgi:PAS domain S-box-containing protein
MKPDTTGIAANQPWLRLLLLGVGCLGCAVLRDILDPEAGLGFNLELVAGVILAALLLNPVRSWPACILVAIAVGLVSDLLFGRSLAAGLVEIFAVSAGAAAGAWLFRRFVSPAPKFDSVSEFPYFFGLAALVGSAVGATVWITAAAVTDRAGGGLVSAWVLWAVGSLSGILLAAPLVLSWAARSGPEGSRFTGWRGLEWAVVVVVSVALAWSTAAFEFRHGLPLRYLNWPIIIYAAVRLGVRGGSVVMLVVAATFAWHINHVAGPLATVVALPPWQRLAVHHGFLAMLTSVSLLLAALVEQSGKRQRRLARSEARYRQIVQTANEGIWVMDADHRTTFVNPSLCRMLGYSEDEMIGRSVESFMVEGELQAHAAQMERRSRGEGGHYERSFRRKDGSVVHTMVSGSSLQDAQGRFAGSLGLFTDITDSKRSDAALLEREAMYRAVVETSQDGFWLVDFEGRILEVNDAYVVRSGYTRDELLRMRVSDLDATEDSAATAAHIEKVIRTGNDLFETRHRTKDGTVWQAEVDTAYWPIAGGRLFVFVRDLNRRNRSEALLRARHNLSDLAEKGHVEHLMQAALDHAELLTGSRIGFFHFVDADQENLTLWAWSTNTLERMCTAVGKGSHYPISQAGVWVDCFHARAPIVHNDYASLSHRKGLPQGHAAISRMVAVPVVRDDRVVSIFGVGNKSTDYTQDDVEAVQSLASIVMDLVGRRRAEESLRASLREKETLLREIHHRVKNNLQLVSSLLNLQAEQTGDPAARAVLVETQGRVRSIALLHETLHHFGDLEQVDLAAYAETLVAHLLHSVSKDPELIRIDCRATPLRLHIDQAIPCGLIINELVMNCLKHAFPDGRRGVVSVDLEIREPKTACLRVTDDGVGLPAGFDPARVQTLGLQLVGDLVGQLGGKLRFGNGPGTVVEVDIPLNSGRSDSSS